MSSFLSTTAFSILVATSWFFIFLTAFPIFVQFVLVNDVNLRLWDVVVGGLPYLVASAAFFVCWLQRRYMLSYRIERIPRRSIAFKNGDAPDPVVDLIQSEYQRVSAIAYYSRPTEGSQLGWGLPGTKYEGIYFKRAFSDAVKRFIDATARKLLPSLPQLSATTRLTNHFHPLSIVIPIDSTALRDADSLMQIAMLAVDNDEPLPFEASTGPQNGIYGRYGETNAQKKERADGEINEQEFERGMAAVQELQTIFEKEIEYLGSDLSTVSDARSQRSYNSAAPSNSPRDHPRGAARRMDPDDAERSSFRRRDSFYRRDGQGFHLDVQGPEDDTGGFYDESYDHGREDINFNWRNGRWSGSPSVRPFIDVPPT